MDKKREIILSKSLIQILSFRRISTVDNEKSMKKYTAAGTDIEEVKRLNSQSGLSYNEVKRMLARKFMNKYSE